MADKLTSTASPALPDGLTLSNKARRPSGKDINGYPGYEKWTNRRWAWEFLRRNKTFMRECANLHAATTTEQRSVIERVIAREFHLKKFKHCDEPYRDQLPVFNEITWWSCQEDLREQKRTVLLQQGQILVKFDLEPALLSDKALTAQLNRAETILKKQLEELATQRKIELTRNAFRAGNAADNLRWLRMLDAKLLADIDAVRIRGDALTDAQIYQLLYPDESRKKIDDEDRAEAFKDVYRTASKLAERDYLKLAIRDQEDRSKRLTSSRNISDR